VLLRQIFNFFVSDCPAIADILESYADDFTVLESDSDLAALNHKLQDSLTPILEWALRKKLMIAPSKSQVTLFTPWSKQYKTHPDVSIDSVDVPLNQFPTILGVTFDPQYTFRNHILNISAKCSQRLNLLKAVCGTSWGHDRQMLFITYKALVESVMSYAAAVWYPNSKPTNVEKLQFIQNAAMRLITGCHKAASIDHLLSETKMMPVAEHLSMLCTQFLANCLGPSHPSHGVVLLPPGPRTNAAGRPMKETLSSRFSAAVSPFLQNGIVPEPSYKSTKEAIHTDAVCTAIDKLKPNPVLGVKAPEVHASKLSLPRVYQTTLNQLRSGKCACLRSYLFFIKSATDDVSPDCNSAPHTTRHLFSCSARPTTLTVWDLWRNLVLTADFISTHPSFNHLLPLNLPLPLPPPEPPP
jgi:hypothetical protein